MPHLLIDDSSYKSQVGEIVIAGTRMARGLKPRDWSKREYGSVAYAGPVTLPLIPVEEWPAHIAELERTKSRLSDLCDATNRGHGVPCLNQKNVGYCHAFSPAYAFMAIRAVNNLPFKLYSASSVGGPVTNYQNRGAWIMDDLRQISEHGISEEQFYPMLTTKNEWTPEGKASAAANRVTEWWECQRRNWMEVGTCALTRTPLCVGLNWWAHAVTYLDLVIVRESTNSIVYGIKFQNSWGEEYGGNGDGRAILELVEVYRDGRVRLGKGVPDEAYAPGVVSAFVAA